MLRVNPGYDKNMDTIMEINFGTCPTTTSLLREFIQTTVMACLSTLFVGSFTHFKHSPSSRYGIYFTMPQDPKAGFCSKISIFGAKYVDLG